ncbi:hypothetical protein SLEP1_g23749 [Rubroshorea leprosula]|uniref:Uncharacterized protein n=1 Tax=Rubroshorea leprosula TaxID=152421 RepID=A0AAV5JGE4_9ROSI|nr:hypothetical protein SLEP1_g23749 [Rubroshorea leprosula]
MVGSIWLKLLLIHQSSQFKIVEYHNTQILISEARKQRIRNEQEGIDGYNTTKMK